MSVALTPILLFVVAGACLAACGPDAEAAAESRATERPAPVEIAAAGPGVLEISERFFGDVRALRRAELSVGAAGEVRFVRVREGDHVHTGDVLLEVDPSLARARVAQAQASHALAREEQSLAAWQAAQAEAAGPRAVAEVEIRRSRTAAETASARQASVEAELRQARTSLALHRIVAPFDGIVVRRAADPGDWMEPGTEAITLVSDDAVEVLVAAPAELVLFVNPGMPAVLEPPSAFRDQLSDDEATVSAEVVGVVPALDEATRTVTIRLVPEEARRWLLAGSSVRVVLRLTRRNDAAVSVPRDALVHGAVGYRVVVVRDDVAQPTPVDVIALGDDAALVRGEQLAPGDTLVTRGNERLRAGQHVEVIEASATSEAASGTGSDESETGASDERAADR